MYTTTMLAYTPTSLGIQPPGFVYITPSSVRNVNKFQKSQLSVLVSKQLLWYADMPGLAHAITMSQPPYLYLQPLALVVETANSSVQTTTSSGN